MSFDVFRQRSSRKQYLIVAGAALACSAAGGGSSPGGSSGTGASGAGNGGQGAAASGGGTGPIIDVDAGSTPAGPCTEGGWICQIDECEGAPKTTLRAKVYDPAGQVPLYNVAVYVPNEEVQPIATGAACETCATPVSGRPVASALTNAQGEFVMEDVPVGTNVPLVIQIGKWRRVIELPEVKRCQENVFDDPEQFRLPRDQSEGHLPKIAMVTGEADSLECLLRRIGVADSEFTNPDGSGRVNLFYDDLGSEPGSTSYESGGSFPPASTGLWASAAAMQAYDIVLMSCQGSQSDGRLKTTAHKQALKTYLDGGGRAFIEHYHYSWLRGANEGPEVEYARKYLPTPFPPIATWATEADPNIDAGGDGDYQIDVSFPKGNDFADWLVNVGASPTKGTIGLIDVKHPALSVLPGTQRWIYNAQSVPYLTVNTPIELAATPEQQCGRLVHTGIHVAIVAGDDTQAAFAGGCTSAALTAQEKAMEFLLFDLSSCVMNDTMPPRPPTVVE
jgi:hypothetical protein